MSCPFRCDPTVGAINILNIWFILMLVYKRDSMSQQSIVLYVLTFMGSFIVPSYGMIISASVFLLLFLDVGVSRLPSCSPRVRF